ncbi:NPCBM/NEW2 domain protein [Pirellula sp. SH-Sr6A]|uniref:DUF1553 domain-containing protein n=1 Tax=Pirellula sp. SH-Sr6A TaxID=1632865 RepID=UPI00078BDD80|nr:DUF1553 domain-containing protein [Pirellula sp. SH-Sr6A]AMV35491.1 NPCBM/NEW2 domain protein [Pirellula sp. SH-Sr6A]
MHSLLSCVRRIPIAIGLVIAISTPICAQEGIAKAEQATEVEFFEKKVRPVLVEHCYECHSAEAKTVQGGLLLDTAQGLLMGGDSGPALIPHQVDKSLIIQAIRYESSEMPPRGKLPKEVISDLENWVANGAIDPRVGTPTAVKKEIDFEEARKFWSFVPPQHPPIPTPQRSDWAESTIDQFTLATMEAQGLSPVRKAGKRELIRRATFDLTGLPPSPEEVESFVADDSSNSFSKVIDRLLDSPAYGERWGRYWLDVARYSEDQAHTFSVQPNTNGYRYRDWVIAAFNADLPFNRFVQLQIAADVMDLDENERLKHLAALGYFGLGAQYYKNTDAAKATADELDDRIDTLTRGFLGLTVSCARCHDHKFDPIPTQDYYSLAGVFHSSRLHNAPLAPEDEVKRYDAAQQKIKEREEEISQAIAKESPKIREARIEEVSRYMLATRAYRAEKSKDPTLKIAAFAKSNDLEEPTLKKWSEYLKSKSDSPPRSLKPWFDETSSTTGEASGSDAASLFQRYLQLLIRQRDGSLTSEEQTELAAQTPIGNARYTSALVTKGAPVVSIDVDLAGAKELVLVVTDGGNGASCDHANWLEPRLITASGEVSLLDLKWRSVSNSYGEVKINKSVSGEALRVAGQTYERGIGTHSTSVITYALPDGALRFQATAGLDNSGSDQPGGCGENAAVQFRVYTEAPTDLSSGQPDLLAELFGEKGVFAMELPWIEGKLSPEVRELLAAQREELEELRRNSPAKYPIAHVIAESKPSDLKVMIRGNPANQGEVAPRRFLRILSSDSPSPFTEGSGRLELARAIASPENPLTARVIVNRVWQHHFGRGLVATPDNFGKLGEPPTHPQLLDYLTLRFLDQGWSLKALHREIMLSATYQLSTDANEVNQQIDADNRYLWRMNRRRLDVEAWRDALLATSGRLDRNLEGPSTNLAEAGNNRRTIYGFISRHELDNMLRLFDFPDANITASTRAETTVPQQQLFVLNSPFMLEQSKAFAARVEREGGEKLENRIRRAYLIAFGRKVLDSELQLGLRYLQSEDSDDTRSNNKLSRWERYAQALLASNEFMYLD